jgi:hypothetical protein
MKTHDRYSTARAKNAQEEPEEAVPAEPAKTPSCQGTCDLLLRTTAEDFMKYPALMRFFRGHFHQKSPQREDSG